MTPDPMIVSQTNAAWSQAHAAYLQVGAAFAQAILSAGAVFAVWKLQDRGAANREAAERARRLEVVANSALWTLRLHHRMVARAKPGTVVGNFPEIARQEELREAIKLLDSVEVISLEDETLTIALLALRISFQSAVSEIEIERTILARYTAQNTPKDIHGFLDRQTTNLFNAAASVERRVAQLVGRPAREDTLSTINTKIVRDEEPLNY